MRHVCIMRDEMAGVRDENEIAKADEYKLHFYPYKDLIIKSHLHPRYAIYQAGFRLTMMTGGDYRQISVEYGEIAGKLMDIYAAWSKDLPETAHAEVSYTP